MPANITLTSLAPVTVAGGLGGLLGALYDHSVQKDPAKAFAQLLAQNNFVPGKVLNADITQALQAKGFSVTQVHAARPSSSFLPAYAAATPPPDAYLDLVLAQGSYFTIGRRAIRLRPPKARIIVPSLPIIF